MEFGIWALTSFSKNLSEAHKKGSGSIKFGGVTSVMYFVAFVSVDVFCFHYCICLVARFPFVNIKFLPAILTCLHSAHH